MYCSSCGTPVAAGLSFCNRCGTSLNKERGGTPETSAANALITAIVLIAVGGLGLICGGSIALKTGGELTEPAVVMFMVLSFAIIGSVELFMVRQLSRVLSKGQNKEHLEQAEKPLFQPALVPASEVRAAHLRTLPEPISSVTENTTRTLEHYFRQS